ncbi:MAG: hypothetical protein U1E83_04420 [Methylotetracoccus sp.]
MKLAASLAIVPLLSALTGSVQADGAVYVPALRATNWAGLIGVDYSPNHYPAGSSFNNHDVFYVGNAPSGQALTNVQVELAQLKAAGFTAVRSYQTVEYAWIDLIQRARALGLSVVYEAAIPINGGPSDISNAKNVLTNVINAVGTQTFQNTVILVLAGHENYQTGKVAYLSNALRQLNTTLSNAGLSSIAVTTALVSGNLVTPSSPSDMQTLIDAASPDAPLGFDPYPFQWGTTPPAQAANNAGLTNSIAWDYTQVEAQSFYPAGRPILMAESGWATAGSGQYANYFCYQQNNCKPGVVPAATYLQALYRYVGQVRNNAGLLVFEAYDEPAKDAANPNDAENYYGVFDTNCALKKNNTNLLPNTTYDPSTPAACQGFVQGINVTVAGTQPGATTNQPPFTVAITQTNPASGLDGSMNVKVPNRDRSNLNVTPWPYFLVYDGARIKISSVNTAGRSCTVRATVSGQTVTWGNVNCTDPAYAVSCSGNACYLPWNDF